LPVAPPSHRSASSGGGSRIRLRLGTAVLGLSLLGYTLPGERVLDQIVEARRGIPPVRLTVVLGPPEAPDLRAWIDLHPAGGWRIVDEQGRKWIGRGSRVLRGNEDDPPVGLVETWLLVAAEEDQLPALVSQVGVDLARTQLARCGESDCFVLGGRDASSQLWVDKDEFVVLKYRSRRGLEIGFEDYGKQSGRLRLPSRLLVLDALGSTAEIEILQVERVPGLERDPELVRGPR
jgi:hypothetical protein